MRGGIFVLTMTLLAACGTGPADTVTISEQDDGKTIEMKTADLLVVSLNGNVTTGFNWIPIPAQQNPVLLEQVGEAEATPGQ